jgi:hypothetical protein
MAALVSTVIRHLLIMKDDSYSSRVDRSRWLGSTVNELPTSFARSKIRMKRLLFASSRYSDDFGVPEFEYTDNFGICDPGRSR